MLSCEIDVAKEKHTVFCMDEKGLGGAVTLGLEAIGQYWLTELMGNFNRKSLTTLDRVFLEYDCLFSNVCFQSPRAVLQEAVSTQQQARQSAGIVFLTDTVHLEMYDLLA